MNLSTLPQWLNWIHSNHHQVIDLGLDRVKTIASRLGVLTMDCPVITVGGTNGKGSTVACLESVYQQAGYEVAAFTSPILVQHNEYLRINGKIVDDDAFCQAYYQIYQILQAITLTPFEFHALASLLIFKQYLDKIKGKAVLLLEVGLGGRLDAVNIIDADLSIVTNVSYDHCEYLGNTLEAIAREKAGIFKAHKPAVYTGQNLFSLMQFYANESGSDLYCLGEDFDFSVMEKWQPVFATASLHPDNIQAALQAVTLLQLKLPVSDEDIKQGLSKITLQGRTEILQKKPLIIMDVAHNPASVANLAFFLEKKPCEGKRIAVFSMLSDKDIKPCLEAIKDDIDEWLLASLQCHRAMSMDNIKKVFESLGIKNTCFYISIAQAFQAATKIIKPEDTLVVFGSFYTIAEVKNEIFQTT